jgi:hypothetical protein
MTAILEKKLGVLFHPLKLYNNLEQKQELQPIGLVNKIFPRTGKIGERVKSRFYPFTG